MKRSCLALFPYVLFLFLTAVSWNRWIQPYVDTGRELMAPWRVSRGQMIYRDFQWYHGPLGPYLAAAVDALSGRRLAGREALGVLFALLHLEALRRLSVRWLSPARACLATSLAVATAFFLRPGGWFFPFSLGTAIAVAAITWAILLVLNGTRSRDLAAAICLLALLISRPDMGLAASVAVLWETRRERRRWWILAGAPIGVSALVYIGISLGTPLRKLVADGWLALLDPPEAFRNVYRAFAGLDHPTLRLAELALAAILVLLAAALLFGVSAAAPRVGPRAGAGIGISALMLLAAATCLSLFPPDSMARVFWLLPPLVRVVPPVVIGVGAALVLLRGIQRFDPIPEISDGTWMIAIYFSTRLLIAAGYVGPYDAFFLPVPLVLSTVLALRATDALAPSAGSLLPRLAAGAFTIFLTGRVGETWQVYRARPWPRVDTPAGSLRLPEPLASTTRQTLADLEARLSRGSRLIGFPEGGFFNYTLGLDNPLSIDQFFPGHLANAAQERDLIARIESNPPAAILFANVLAVGEQTPAFGKDYFPELDRYLRTRFVPVSSYGPGAGPDARIGDSQFFITIRVPVAKHR